MPNGTDEAEDRHSNFYDAWVNLSVLSAIHKNSQALRAFRPEITRHWRHTLQRRSQKGYVTRQRMRLLDDQWLPQPRILHPWPDVRFNAKTQGRSPVR